MNHTSKAARKSPHPSCGRLSQDQQRLKIFAQAVERVITTNCDPSLPYWSNLNQFSAADFAEFQSSFLRSGRDQSKSEEAGQQSPQPDPAQTPHTRSLLATELNNRGSPRGPQVSEPVLATLGNAAPSMATSPRSGAPRAKPPRASSDLSTTSSVAPGANLQRTTSPQASTPRTISTRATASSASVRCYSDDRGLP